MLNSKNSNQIIKVFVVCLLLQMIFSENWVPYTQTKYFSLYSVPAIKIPSGLINPEISVKTLTPEHISYAWIFNGTNIVQTFSDLTTNFTQAFSLGNYDNFYVNGLTYDDSA